MYLVTVVIRMRAVKNTESIDIQELPILQRKKRVYLFLGLDKVLLQIHCTAPNRSYSACKFDKKSVGH